MRHGRPQNNGGPCGGAGVARARRVLAVASGGGHWEQLMLLRPAFGCCEIRYVTTVPGLPELHDAAPAAIVPDCNRDRPLLALRSVTGIARQVAAFRPHVVISTGALPGVIALAIGRATGARTVWIDSIANSEEMSLSGQIARRVADLWISQWPEVARRSGAIYAGSIL